MKREFSRKCRQNALKSSGCSI